MEVTLDPADLDPDNPSDMLRALKIPVTTHRRFHKKWMGLRGALSAFINAHHRRETP
jgi:hypothetical protein